MLEKKKLFAGGVMLTSLALLAGAFLLGSNALSASNPKNDTAKAPKTSNIAERFKNAADGDDSPYNESGLTMNGTQARWKDGKWEYSDDGGKTWTDETPEGVTTDGAGRMRIGQGDDADDFDFDEWEKELDEWLESVLEKANGYLRENMPEGYEDWNSFFTFGDTIARQKDDGGWEFSRDGGETWTDEAPEGFSASEDGSRFRVGGDSDSEDFEWPDVWPEGSKNTNVGKPIEA